MYLAHKKIITWLHWLIVHTAHAISRFQNVLHQDENMTPLLETVNKLT